MSPRSRLIALGATALGLWLARGQFVTSDDALAVTPVRRLPSAGSRAANPGGPAVAPLAGQPLPERSALQGALTDPFARPRIVVKPPPPAPPPPPVVASPPPSAPAPPPVPRVPYKFVGLLSENGKPASVYLAVGETLIDARPGDVLDGGYQLKSISAKELTFLHQQSNLTVRMAVDGEPL